MPLGDSRQFTYISVIQGNWLIAYSETGGTFAYNNGSSLPYQLPSNITGMAGNPNSSVLYYSLANKIYKVSNPLNGAPSVTAVAGTGTSGYTGDGGAAISAEITTSGDIYLSAANAVYTSSHNVIRVISNGIINSVAGNNTSFFGTSSGDGLNAKLAQFGGGNMVLASDASGDILVADINAERVRMINTSQMISTVAGGGTLGLNDGGNATDATFTGLSGIAADNSGNFYVACNSRIREINSSGIINTIAGGGSTTPANKRCRHIGKYRIAEKCFISEWKYLFSFQRRNLADTN